MGGKLLIRYSIIFLALLGLLLSLYLFKTHFEPLQKRFCDLSETFNCDTVNQSEYAELLGIPISLFGVLHYALLTFLLLLGHRLTKWFVREERLLYLALSFEVAFGLLFSFYLTSVEAFILHVYCPLCIVSAIITLFHLPLMITLWRITPFE